MTSSSFSNIKLLYVEDDALIRDVFLEILRDKFSKLSVAVDGKDGLSQYNEFHPNIILTDIRMPVMDGLEMIKSIRKDNKEIPIIISSAFNDSRFLLEAIDLGINHYLLKPLNLKKLFDTLESIAEDLLIKKN